MIANLFSTRGDMYQFDDRDHWDRSPRERAVRALLGM